MSTKHIYLVTLITGIIALFCIMLPYQNTPIDIIRVISGSIFILFLPGYYITKSFFNNSEIDILERFALSFALSISMIPLISFYGNIAGLPINQMSIFLISMSIIAINLLYIHFGKSGKTI